MQRRTILAAALGSAGAAYTNAAMNLPGSYEIWDVFSSTKMLGNPLAVFPDAGAIPENQLGAIAREMGHSETTFIYPRGASIEKQEGVRTRIFSRIGTEMPFAGHPVLGTAFSLHARHAVERVLLSLPAGKVPVDFRRRSDSAWEGEMTQPEPVFAERHDSAVLAPLLGLNADDFDPALPLENVSTGRPNVLVFLKTRAAVRRVAIDWRGLDAYFAAGDHERGIYLLTRDVEQPAAQFHARKPGRLGDDPVTGSAAGCAIAALVRHGLVESGQRITIEQGSEVNRRGELFASATQKAGVTGGVKVGGQAVCCARGVLL